MSISLAWTTVGSHFDPATKFLKFIHNSIGLIGVLLPCLGVDPGKVQPATLHHFDQKWKLFDQVVASLNIIGLFANQFLISVDLNNPVAYSCHNGPSHDA